MTEPAPLGTAIRGDPSSALRRALTGSCPHCGAHTLFKSWVGFAPRCAGCGLDFSSFNVGDGPAAFLILIVGAIVVVGALVVDARFEPPWWVHLVWIPVAAALTIGGLRVAKAWLLGQEWRVSRPGGMASDSPRQSGPATRHRAREGRISK